MVNAVTVETPEMAAARQGMALNEFIRRFDEQPFELIDGELMPMSPTVFGLDFLKHRPFLWLHDHVVAHKLGDVFVETPFTASDSDDPNWVSGSVVPNIMFIAGADRLAAYKAVTPDWKQRPLALVPDLTIEIMSANDRYSKVLRKIAYCLELGVKAVWLFNDMRQSVTIYTPDDDPITLIGGQKLEHTGLLPGFSITLPDLFAN